MEDRKLVVGCREHPKIDMAGVDRPWTRKRWEKGLRFGTERSNMGVYCGQCAVDAMDDVDSRRCACRGWSKIGALLWRKKR